MIFLSVQLDSHQHNRMSLYLYVINLAICRKESIDDFELIMVSECIKVGTTVCEREFAKKKIHIQI